MIAIDYLDKEENAKDAKIVNDANPGKAAADSTPGEAVQTTEDVTHDVIVAKQARQFDFIDKEVFIYHMFSKGKSLLLSKQ